MDIVNEVEDFAKANKIELIPQKLSGFLAYEIEKQSLAIMLQFLQNSDTLRFTILTDLFATDFPNLSNRFEIVYNLLSLKLNKRFILKLRVKETESVPSIVQIFSAACGYEREIFDMFGVEFENSHDMRRILTDYGFKGHPLRKDFPLTGHLQIRYDEQLQKIIHEPVLLEQEYRSFDFRSPWRGNDGLLPGDEKAN